MPKESRDAMINPQLLRDRVYKDTSRLDRRKALYQYTYPHFSIEDEVLDLQRLGDKQSLLDVGCGTGKLLLNAALLFPNAQLVGVDISAGMFKTAKEKAEAEGLNIAFQAGDVQHLPFADGSFDRVTAMHMLYHAPDIHQALRELARVVKPDGMVLITANSRKSRTELGFLKSQAAAMMGREIFTDPNMRFNLENGLEMIGAHFNHMLLVPFESTLRLTDPQPYIDYFDSLREFWQPTPTDEEWSKVMDSTRQYIESQIVAKGEFSDRTGFGVMITSHFPIPTELIQKATKE